MEEHAIGFRLRSIDIFRGAAIAGVVIFHIVWDLDYTRLIAPGLAGHPMWLLFGRSLAGSFMFLVGVSLVLAHRSEFRWSPFVKRLLVIALAALAISVVTRIAFPQSFVYFGILHAITAASILGILFLRLPVVLVAALGALMIAAPNFIGSSLFNHRLIAWVGFAQQPPLSNDYVPIFPWVGVTLLGIVLTRVAISRSMHMWLYSHEPRGPVAASFGWMGRHSLPIYLVHQPVLLGILIPFSNWFR